MRGEFSEGNAKRNVCVTVSGEGVLIGGFGWREMELKKD